MRCKGSADRANPHARAVGLFDNHTYETKMVDERLGPVALSDSLN